MTDLGLPDPTTATDLDGLVTCLRLLKVWAGDPSYAVITTRVAGLWRDRGEVPRRSTVADCFRTGRRRMDEELLAAVVHVLRPDAGYVEAWRSALRAMRGDAVRAAIVAAYDDLPPDPPGFVGRAADLAIVEAGAPLVVVHGMAGVGKTRFAVHAAHRLTRRGYGRDVRLFVDLRGFDPVAPPADPAAVLGEFLRALGVPGDRVPPGLEARAARFRDLLRGASALVVLDNAADAASVRPLLPDGPHCVALVTTRRRPDEPAAVRVELDAFDAAESLDLLRRTAGGHRVDQDPETATRITELVGRLPLALAIAGSHLRDHPDWPLVDYLESLTGLALEGGARAALALSDRGLPADARAALRLLSLHPGPDFDAHAAAAVAGSPEVGPLLAALTAAHLVQRRGDRYGLHDLVRAYGRERAAIEDPPSRTRAAVGRLFDRYRFAALAAVDLLYPFEKGRRPRLAAVTPDLPTPDTVEAARAWLDVELPNLVAIACHDARRWPEHTADLATILNRHLDTVGRYDTVVALQEHVLVAGRARGSRLDEGHALMNLGISAARQGSYDRAGAYLARAVEAYWDAGDVVAVGRALGNLANVHTLKGRYEESLSCHEEALRIARDTGDRLSEGRVSTNVGLVSRYLGRHEDALVHYERSLEITREVGDRTGECLALDNIGHAHRLLGRVEEAVPLHVEALAIAREAGFGYGAGLALANLGAAQAALGRHDEALTYYEEASAALEATGDFERIGVLNDTGGVLLTLGRAAEALAHHEMALAAADDIGERREAARALTGAGDAHAALGAPEEAVSHWTRARDRYATDPEAAELDHRLRTVRRTV
ncbi:tetratricopeptide repeat protein [Saccharothrix violaceirubra]|uniref:Tetratricopeptide (TPR) repeat protein n=1 Tax=Saccharothrix violaceirubra TaxID=413306 RepID=A0A7W7T310_9PSEU|nr:tetratricopeptide repeat protein [Saccharothrix violaceirubra]MBB4965321.1 tetratricopeptide (TPR) repeat protein [Saccharothrix violaceirubra]